MHQSVPSANVPPANPRALFSHGQIPAPGQEDFAKYASSGQKIWTKTPPGENFLPFLIQ